MIQNQQPSDTICERVKYIDCRGWYDFSAEAVCLLVAFYLLFNVIATLRNLKRELEEENQSQYKKSLRRKTILAIIQLIYLLVFVASICFQIYVFVNFSLLGKNLYTHENLENPSKILEALFVNILNCLNLTVGLLYWKATRGYYVLSELPIPIIYSPSIKIIFFLFYSLNISAFIITLFFLLTQYIFSNSIQVFNLISTTISIVFCIAWRSLYRKKILKMVQLPLRAVKKEVFCSVLLFVSGFFRIVLFLLEVIDDVNDWAKHLRHYKSNQMCIDQAPYFALCILFIHLVINLLPSLIYCYLFRAERTGVLKKSRKKMSEQLEKPIMNEQQEQGKIHKRSLLGDSRQLDKKNKRIIRS